MGSSLKNALAKTLREIGRLDRSLFTLDWISEPLQNAFRPRRNDGIAAMLCAGQTWSQVQAAIGCSRATVAKIAKRIDAEDGLVPA